MGSVVDNLIITLTPNFKLKIYDPGTTYRVY